MSRQRPTVSPQLLSAVIESAPDRVRRRLDRKPDAASEWNWELRDDDWTIAAGTESVSLPATPIESIEQVGCTCLLTPNCFHVLACLTSLEVSVGEHAGAEDASSTSAAGARSACDLREDVTTTDSQRQSAAALAESLALLLRVGVASAGVVVQSGLLRAVHQSRAEGLHRAAAAGLRVITGVGQIRTREAESDPAQLASDIAEVLETTRHLQSNEPFPAFWLGAARREQFPVKPRKLHGLLAEPVVTRSGYVGAAVYFLGEDNQVYTVAALRPGDSQLARDAYLGGIEVGQLIQPAKQIARGLAGSDLLGVRSVTTSAGVACPTRSGPAWRAHFSTRRPAGRSAATLDRLHAFRRFDAAASQAQHPSGSGFAEPQRLRNGRRAAGCAHAASAPWGSEQLGYLSRGSRLSARLSLGIGQSNHTAVRLW